MCSRYGSLHRAEHRGCHKQDNPALDAEAISYPSNPSARSFLPVSYRKQHDAIEYATNNATVTKGTVAEKTSMPSIASAKEPRRMQPSLSRKLGWQTCGTMISSSIGLAAALIFIIWLWNVDKRSSLWREIALRNWLTRCVTLSALVMRWAVSSQAILATSMIAALSLENRGAALPNAAEFSITRYVNSGPLYFLYSTLMSSRGFRDWVQVCILILLSITSLALQFTSTFLVSDINPAGGIDGHRVQNQSFSTISGKAMKGNMITSPGCLSRRPNSFETFAEYVEQPLVLPNSTDTGVTLRGFLPLPNQQNRTDIRIYNGTASLVDARVFCTQPTLNLTVAKFTVSTYGDFYHLPNLDNTFLSLTLVGSATPSQNFNVQDNTDGTDLLPPPAAIQFNFTAKSTSTTPIIFAGAQNSTAEGGIQGRGLVSRLNPVYLNNYGERRGNVFLIVDPHLLCQSNPLGCLDARDVKIAPSSDWFTLGDGPWTNLTTFHQDQYIRFSLCYDALYDHTIQDIDVTVFAAPNSVEPQPTRDIFSNSFNVSDILDQLQGTREPQTSRAMSFDTTNLLRQIHGMASDEAWLPNVWGDIAGSSGQVTWQQCDANFASSNSSFCVDSLKWRIFNETLSSTGNPALALQALNTVTLRQMYYDMLPFFDGLSDATMVNIVSRPMPSTKRGFLAVLVLTLIHEVLVGIVLIRFVLRTERTLLNNSWQVVSQLRHPELEGILEESTASTDQEVKMKLKDSGMAGLRFRLTDNMNVRTSSKASSFVSQEEARDEFAHESQDCVLPDVDDRDR
jgi:hypothetical protein